MSTNTDEKYKTIKAMCNDLNISKGKTSDEYLFTIDATDLVFFKRNIGESDIKYGFTDGSNDGGIDFIYSDNDTLYLIQGKSTSSLSIKDIKTLFGQMAETVSNFENKKTDQYSAKLRSAFLNAYESLNDDKNIELVLFTNTELSDPVKNDLLDFANTDLMNDYTLTVYDYKDLEEQDAILFQGSDLIPEDSIRLDPSGQSKNVLTYGDAGIIVNISANDLKRLYLKYGKNGLFSYNLREHISQKSVDDGIDNTIKTEKDNFWFYNNGITIGCNDFYQDGNKIRLYDFSIINGAQTTTKIGQSKLINEDYDFALVCKIVRAKNSLNKDSAFISKISEASNSQKPIKQRDLRANAPEQKILQNKCAKNKYPLAVEIKRGVHPANYKKIEKWQRVTNEYLGQLIYACILQYPGPARNQKNTIFSSSKVYKQLFLRNQDCDTLYDLVRIGSVYDEYADDRVKSTDDVDRIAIIKNGKLTIMAITIYLVKKLRKIITDSADPDLNKDNISGLLITDYPGDDLDKNLYNIYDFIVRVLTQVYAENKVDMKITSYSNFFKNDQLYALTLKKFDTLDDYDQEKLDSFLKIFTEKKPKF